MRTIDASIHEELSRTREQAMKAPRIIKKYPNRRLYDTTDSRYITLCDIRQLVVDGEPFEVIDKKSGEDITRSILLHVIAEQEERGESVMSEVFLARIIRAYNGKMPQMVRGYLEETLSLFLEQQQQIGESIDHDGAASIGRVSAESDKTL